MRIATIALILGALGLIALSGCHSSGHHDRAPQKTTVKIQQP